MRKELIVLTGFLGSGKTTLLQRLLAEMTDKQGRKLAVLLNDFGEVPVDGTLLNGHGSRQDVRLVEISGGSIFCACLKTSFVKALMELARTDAQTVLVESSGMSDPSGVARMLELAELTESFAPPRVLCLFDPFRSVQLSHVLEVIGRQVRAADVVFVTKSDLALPEQLTAAQDRIRELDPQVPVLTLRRDEPLPSLLPGRNAVTAMGFNTPDNRPDSFIVRAAPQGIASLLRALENAPAVLRCKGYLSEESRHGQKQRFFVSDTGQGWTQQAAAPDETTPFTVICLRGEGTALERRLRDARLIA